MRWLDSITNSMNMKLTKLWEIAEDRGIWHAADHEITESNTTQPLNTSNVCTWAFPGGLVVKNVAANTGDTGFIPESEDPLRRWEPTLVVLPEKSHGQRYPVGYSPWNCKESNTTEQLSMHAHMYVYTHACIYVFKTDNCAQFQLQQTRIELEKYLLYKRKTVNMIFLPKRNSDDSILICRNKIL